MEIVSLKHFATSLPVSKRSVNRVLVVALHLCGWALLFMLPFRFLARNPRGYGKPLTDMPGNVIQSVPFDPSWFRIEVIVTNCLLAIFFYANMYLLVPRILSKKGWAPYLAIVVGCLVVYLLIGHSIRMNFIPADLLGGPVVFFGMPNFLMVFGLSLALRIMQDRNTFEVRLQEQENEKLKSELSFLRSQVSPHFMFNVLNSLASLARKKSDKVEAAIIQLSHLMRYSLYHTDKKVTLDQEADYLGNYIALQKLRFGSVVNMHFHVNIEQKDVLLEPMLLVPFVENAFKHGVGLMREPVIMIVLEASASCIHFTVRNKFMTDRRDVQHTGSGIGLQNVRRRLDLLYHGAYSLNTYTDNGNWFVAELKIRT